jgi:phosphopantetheinyl transferase (holo-ACP synthase)
MNEIDAKAFSVRREVVLKALKWLKEYNVLYKEIEIVEDNLNWIEGGVEQSLPYIDIIEESAEQETAASIDMGPSISQVADVLVTE